MSNFYREHIDSSVQESCTLQRIQYFDTPYHVFLLGTFINRCIEYTEIIKYKNNNKECTSNCGCTVEAEKESYRLLTFTKVNYHEVCKSKLSSSCCYTSASSLPSRKHVNVNDLLVYSLRSSELSRDEAYTFVNSFHDNCLRCGNREVEVSCGESVGILGCVRFTQGYYLVLASSRTHVASIRTCNVYEINNYILLSLMTEMSDNDTNVNNVTLREQSPLTLFQQPAPSQTPSTSSFFNLSWWTNWGSTNTPTDKTISNSNINNNRSTNNDNKRRSYSSSCTSSSSLHYTEPQKMRKHRSTNSAHGLKRLSSRIASAAAPYLFNTRTSEDHYVEQFLANNMKHSFYFAHDYDLTNTLQANNSVTSGGNAKKLHKRMKYVWNTFLLEPFAIETATRKSKCFSSKHKHVNKYSKTNSRKKESAQAFMGESDFVFPAGLSCWLLYCIHGAITQQVIMPQYCESVQNTSHSTTTMNNNIDIVKEIKRDTVVETATNSLNSTSISTPPECSLLHIILIARVSKDFAGTRYLRRGVSADGRVANHVEIEQIVCVAKEEKRKPLESSTPQSINLETEIETNCNKNNNTKSCKQFDVKEQENEEKESINCTSYVQVRGSIPIRWFHPQTSLPKPPIEIGFSDLVDSTTITHFQELICDYGTPVIVMNLVRQHERHERESALGKVYCAATDKLQAAVEYDKLKYDHHHEEWKQENVNTSENNVLYYRAVDLKHVADEAWNVVTAAAESDMIKTGIYADSLCSELNTKSKKCRLNETNKSRNIERGLHTQVQCGVVRTNCIDCIDRTNICQFIYGLHALGVQLHALGFLAESTDLIASHVLQETLLSMYFTLGDALATQYGGSAHVGAGVLHRGAGWDQLMGMKRLYHNVLGDKTKQVALNLFLGRVQPEPLQPSRSMNLYMALPFQVHHLEQLRQIQNAINSTRSLQRHKSEQHTKRRRKRNVKKSNNTTLVPSAMKIDSTAEIENSSAELHKSITFDEADTTNVELFAINNNSVGLDDIDKQCKNRETHCSKSLENKCLETSTSSSSSSTSSYSSSSSFEDESERNMKIESHERLNKTGQKRHNNANNDNRRAVEYLDKQQPMHLSTAQSFLARFFVGKKRPLLHHHHHHCHSVNYLSSSSSKHVDSRSTTLCNLHNSDKVKMTHQTDNCKDDVESVKKKIITTTRVASGAKEQQKLQQLQEELIQEKSKLDRLSVRSVIGLSRTTNSKNNTNKYVINDYTHIADVITTCNAVDDYGSDVYVDLVNESEGDYYLHSQQTPHLPNLTLWRHWWKAPLLCYNERQSNIITPENEESRVPNVNNTLESSNTNEHFDSITTESAEETLKTANTENTMTMETNNGMTEDLILSYSHHHQNTKSKSNDTRSDYNISHLYRSGKMEINLPMEEFTKSKQEAKTIIDVHASPEKSKSALSEPSAEHVIEQRVVAFVATCGKQREQSRESVNTTANIALTQTTVTISTTHLSIICRFLQAVQKRSVENLTYFSSSEPMVSELNMIFGPIFKEKSTNGSNAIVYNSEAHYNHDKMCEFTVQHYNFAKEVHDSLYQENSTYYKNVSSHCLDALTYDEACRFVFIKFGQPLEWDADTVCDALIAYAPDLSQDTFYNIRNTLRWTGNDIVENGVNMELIKNDKEIITQFVTHVQEYAKQELLIHEKSYNCNSGAIGKASFLTSMHEAYCAQYKKTLHKIVKHFFKFDVRVDQVFHVLQTFVSRMTDVETGVRCQSFTRYTDTFASHDKPKSHIPLAGVVKHAFSLETLLDWLENNAQCCHLRLDAECTMHGQGSRAAWQLVEFLYYMSIIVPVVQLTLNSDDDDDDNDHDKNNAMLTQIQLHDKTALFRFGYHVKRNCTYNCAADNDNNDYHLYNFVINESPWKYNRDNKEEIQNEAYSSMHRSVSHVIYFIDACQLSESWAGIALNMFTSLRKHIYANNNDNNNIVRPRAILLSERTTLAASFLHEMNALSHVLTEISLDVSSFQGVLTSHYVIAFFINVYNILYIHTWMLLYCVELHSLMIALAVPIDGKAQELSSTTSAISHFTSSYMYKSLWKSSNEFTNNAITIEESLFYEGFGYVIGKRENATQWHVTLSSIKNDILRCHELPPSYTCLPAVLEKSTICTNRETNYNQVDVFHCVNNEYCKHVDNINKIVNLSVDEDKEQLNYTSINSLISHDCKTVTEYIRTHALVLCERYHRHRVTRTTQHDSPSERSAQDIDEICYTWIANMHHDRIQRRIALALLDTYIPPSETLPNVIESVTHSVTCDVLEHLTHEWSNTSVNSKTDSANLSKYNVGNCNENDKTNFTKGMECSTSVDTNCEVDLWNWSRKNDFYDKESVDRHIFVRHLPRANNNNSNDESVVKREGSINNNEDNSSSKQRWEHLCCPMQPTQLYCQLHDIEYNFLHTLRLSPHHTASTSPPSKPLLYVMSVLTTQYTNVFGTTLHDVRTFLKKDRACADALYEAQHKLQQSFRALNL